MSEDTPDVEVTEGELEWEPGNIINVDPHELTAFEKNEEIYGDTEEVDNKFIESVREKGVLEPLVVDEDKTIISGHRRWSAAKDVGVESVPVRVSEFESELEKREALIEFNRQRDKTPGQVINEFEEILDIKQTRGKKNMSLGGQGGKEGSPNLENLDSDYDAWKDAAEEFEVGKSSLSKGKKVKDIATGQTDKPKEVVEVAQQKWDELEEGEESFHGALKDVKKAEESFEYKEGIKKKSSKFDKTLQDGDAVEVIHGDFNKKLEEYGEESFDHIFTDPPYDEDALELWENLAKQAERVLKSGGFLVAYSGQTYLPEVYSILDQHLDYVWQLTVTHSNPHMHPYHNIKIGYKPVIVFGKDVDQYTKDVISDLIDIGEMEKTDHEWQQSVLEVDEMVNCITEKNDLILDPMCGSGTTGVSCLKNKRRSVLMDIDKESVEKTKSRLSEVM